MQLYIANKNYSSWSLRPWILMQELEFQFEEVMAPLIQNGSWAEYRKFSPSGTVPCLIDDETTVWDSLAIVEYLAEIKKEVWPADNKARTWARSATAEMHSGFFAIRNICSMCCAIRVDLYEVSYELQKNIDRIDELWNQGLNDFGGDFLAGDCFTAVDAFFAPVVFRIQSYGLKLSEVSMRYVERMLARESMQSWYRAGIAEDWFEPGHEKEISKVGRITQDLRKEV